MRACLKEHSGVPSRPWHPQAIEVFLRFPPEAIPPLGVGALWLLAWGVRALLRRQNLRAADELRSQARARRREAANLDAEADRLAHGS
jgi:hypothetical protein